MKKITARHLQRTALAVVINGLLVGGIAIAAPPGKPSLNPSYTFATVTTDRDGVAYESLVQENDQFTVTWNIWYGDLGQTARVLFDDEIVWQGPASAKKADFSFDKGGKYSMVIELENSDGITRSDAIPVTVGDTEGSHLTPLETRWTENNKPYKNTTDKIVGTYFVEWGIYGRKYPLSKAPVSNLNRLIYGFIPICGGDGINDSLKTISGSFESLQKACAGRDDFKVAIHDPWAAVNVDIADYPLPYDAPFRGNYAMLMAAKKANPQLKVLPSIGGWTLSDPFFFMDDASKRKIFIDSVEEFLRTWRFWDGVDIDFEFPGGGGANPNLGDKEKDGETYVTIMREIRSMLDKLGAEFGRYYELTSAISVGSDKIEVVDYGKAAQYLDNIYLMSYDFYGAWDNNDLNHQTALHESSVNPDNKYFASRGVDLLLKQGVPSEKLVLGVAAYGRGWTGVANYVEGNPFTGRATGPIEGTWEPGVLDYRDIVDNHTGGNWVDGYDEQAEAPYKFNAAKGDLITYDNPRSVIAKAEYVMDMNLGGIFHWEMDGDNGDLVNAMHEGLGHGGGSGEPANRDPIANAGMDKNVLGEAEVPLDGSRSKDPEGEVLIYKWTQQGGNLRITNSDKANATVVVPEVSTDTKYTFMLTVTDPEGASSTDTVIINNKVPTYNQAPTVTLPDVTNVNEGQQVTITAVGKDPDGDVLDYTWQIDPSFMLMSAANGPSITLQAPDVIQNTDYPITVSVTDSEVEATTSAKVMVKNVEAPDVTLPDPEGGCSTTDSSASSYPAWDASSVYTTETVSHNGLIYKAKWWVQGSEPTPSNEAWELLSDVELPWNPAVAYQGNQQVNHNGSRWQAKWWTQGGEPGVDAVWVNVGAATCN